MQDSEFVAAFKPLIEWLERADLIKVNGTVHGTVDNPEETVTFVNPRFTIAEDDGAGELSGEEIDFRPDNVESLEWNADENFCHVTMTDGQGYEFTSYTMEERLIPYDLSNGN